MMELFLVLISTDVGKPASRDAWSVIEVWIALVIVCYLVLHALLLRVREKTCVSDNRVLAACRERTMYHQLTVEAPATMSRPEQFCLNLLFP